MKELMIVTKNYQPAVIEINYAEIEKSALELKAKYETMVFAEDDIQEAKKVRVGLNKVIKAIDTFRKDKKKELTQSVTDFENQMKNLTSIVKDASESIDQQCKNYQAKVQEERKQLAKEIIQETEEKFDVHGLVVEEWYWSKANSKVALVKDIERQAQEIVDERERVAKEIELISQQVKMNSQNLDTPLNVEFYTKMQGKKEVSEILLQIGKDAQRQKTAEETAKKKAIEAEQCRVEQERIKAKEEEKTRIQAELKKQQPAQKNFETDNIKAFEPIVEFKPIEENVSFDPAPQEEETHIYTINMKATKSVNDKIIDYAKSLGAEITCNENMDW